MILAWVFLTVSLVAVAMQSMALARLARGADRGPVAMGLLRTGACRVVAASAYVALAVVSLAAAGGTGALAVAVFTAVQLMWITNGFLDVRLRRRLSSPSRPSSSRPQEAPVIRTVAATDGRHRQKEPTDRASG
jgi:hypothetical protein